MLPVLHLDLIQEKGVFIVSTSHYLHSLRIRGTESRPGFRSV